MPSTSYYIFILITLLATDSNSAASSQGSSLANDTQNITESANNSIVYETKIEIGIVTEKIDYNLSEKLATIVQQGILNNWANHLDSSVDDLNISSNGNVFVELTSVEYEEDIARITFKSYWNSKPIPAKIVTRDLTHLNLRKITEILGYTVHKISNYSISESFFHKWWMIASIAVCGFIISLVGFVIIFLSLNCNQSKVCLSPQNQARISIYTDSFEPPRPNTMELSVEQDNNVQTHNIPIDQLKLSDALVEQSIQTQTDNKCEENAVKAQASEGSSQDMIDMEIMNKNSSTENELTPDSVEDYYMRRLDRPKTASTARKYAHVLDDIESNGTGGAGHFNPYYAADKVYTITNEMDRIGFIASSHNHPKPTYFQAYQDIYTD